MSNLLTRMRRICLALPDTAESSRLGGSPHFYVRGKIFAGCGDQDGKWTFGVKVGRELQAELIERPGFRVAKYVGRYGWIEVDEDALVDRDELSRLVHLSYGLISGDAECTLRPARAAAKKKAKKPAKKAPRARRRP